MALASGASSAWSQGFGPEQGQQLAAAAELPLAQAT